MNFCVLCTTWVLLGLEKMNDPVQVGPGQGGPSLEEPVFMKSNHPLLVYQHHVGSHCVRQWQFGPIHTGFDSMPQTNRLPFARNIEPPKPHIVPSEVCTCDRAHKYYSHEMLRNKSKVVNTGNGHLSTNGLSAQRKCPHFSTFSWKMRSARSWAIQQEPSQPAFFEFRPGNTQHPRNTISLHPFNLLLIKLTTSSYIQKQKPEKCLTTPMSSRHCNKVSWQQGDDSSLHQAGILEGKTKAVFKFAPAMEHLTPNDRWHEVQTPQRLPLREKGSFRTLKCHRSSGWFVTVESTTAKTAGILFTSPKITKSHYHRSMFQHLLKNAQNID